MTEYVSRHEIKHHAKNLPDSKVDDQPAIRGMLNEMALAEARQVAALYNSRTVSAHLDAVGEAVRQAERELGAIAIDQLDSAIAALLNDADAIAKFAARERRADQLRALLRYHEIAKPRLQEEAHLASVALRSTAEAIARIQQRLDGARRDAKQAIARQQTQPRVG